MAAIAIDAVVFDILGTLVDQAGGLRAAVGAALPATDPRTVDDLVRAWGEHVGREQRRIVDGQRSFVPSDVLDAEAAALVAGRAGVTDPAAVAALAAAANRLSPWPDTLDGLARLAASHPVIGLSNAGRSALLRLNAHSGLRWHQALSVELVATYKPDPAVYRLAADVAAVPPDRLLMVAAHPWDLRGAAATGMRTAFVARPAGQRPADTDSFDLTVGGIDELADRI